MRLLAELLLYKQIYVFHLVYILLLFNNCDFYFFSNSYFAIS